MKRIIGTAFFLLLFSKSWAQHLQFSQYNFTDQRVNPALVAASDYAQLNFDFRNQSTGGDFNLSTTYLSGSYPLLSKKGLRWSGIGLSVMDDRSGVGGIFNTQEISLAYAINIFLSRYQTLTFGVRGLYLNQKINADGLFTGSQYIPDRGFDGAMSIGENLQQYRVDYFTSSFGLYWQQVDRWQHKIAYWGISFYDFNNPESSFLEGGGKLHSTIVMTGGLQVYKKDNLSILPEVLYTRNSVNNVVNIGARWGYEIKPAANQVAAKIDILTKYVVGRSMILGLQLHREKFSVGVSYDLPIAKYNVGNLGAIEVGLCLKKLVSARERNRRKAEQTRAKKETLKKEISKKVLVKRAPATIDSVDFESEKKEIDALNVMEELKIKNDSVLASVQVGEVKHEPFVLKKVNFHAAFNFNSATLDQDSKRYLDDLVVALKENEFLKVQLTGHTDNVGSERFNKILSLARAEELANYLIAKGINSKRIAVAGMGETQSIAENETEEGRTKNRRVEVTVSGM